MTDLELQRYYDVSLPPSVWGGGGEAPGPVAAQAAGKALPDDPDAFTIAEVEEWVADNPDEVETVLAAELEGKNRTTLVAWLTEQLEELEDPEG